MPYLQPVSGNLHLDWVVRSHGNPGYLRKLEAELSTAGGDVGLRTIFAGGPLWACPIFDCAWTIPTDFDTTVSPYDGIQQYQPRMPVREPDGNDMRPSLRFPFIAANGKPVRDNLSTTNVPLGYGWYGPSSGGALYAWARLDSGVPTAPVSGNWTFRASFLSDGGGLSTTHYRIAVDPALHADPPDPGITVADADTSCTPGTRGCSGPRRGTFTIDTTKLTVGEHRLSLRADALDPGRRSTNSGAFVAPFTVAR